MFQTIKYKGGYIQIACFGNRETITVQDRYGESLGEVKSVHAAKIRLSKELTKVKAQRAADAAAHHARVQAIVAA